MHWNIRYLKVLVQDKKIEEKAELFAQNKIQLILAAREISLDILKKEEKSFKNRIWLQGCKKWKNCPACIKIYAHQTLKELTT